MRNPIPPRRLISPHPNAGCVRPLLLALAAAAAFLGSLALAAQAPSASPAPPAAAHQALHPHARHKAKVTAPAPKQAEVVPVSVAPPPPEPPHWPANDKPVQAAIVWDSQGLRIDAANSSLQQILKEVSSVTGANVEGMGTDERVFGAYGPGLARDVLSQLLRGSNYNVLMIGDQGQGAPREIVLTSRNPKDAASVDKNGNSGDDDSGDNDADEQAQPQTAAPAPVPARPPYSPGGPPRTPQQLMQQRQQEMQQRNAQPPGNGPQN